LVKDRKGINIGLFIQNLFTMDNNITRDYALSELPTLELPRDNGESLKAIYTEVNANYRYLADIQFKLLGFVPAISAIAWVELLDKIRPDALHRWGR